MKPLLPLLLLALMLGGCTQWNAYRLTGSYKADTGEKAVFTGSEVTMSFPKTSEAVFTYKVEGDKVYLHNPMLEMLAMGLGGMVAPEFQIVDGNTVRYVVVGSEKEPITFHRVP
jgi:hypothetical protein